ncbi:MAG: class I adenylate-forming enzyme family protein [Actinomycetes bacterium]
MSQSPAARTLPDLVREFSAATPDAEALVSTDGDRMTYAQLERSMLEVSAGLREQGIGRGDTVGLLAPNLIEWVPTALAVQELGARVAAFNTFVKPLELVFLLEKSQCKTLVVADRVGRHSLLDVLSEVLPELWEAPPWTADRYPHLRSVVLLGADVPPGATPWSALLGKQDSLPTASSPDQDAVIVYTSGSTARPKAVPLEHGALVENGFGIGERMQLTAQDRVWLGSPLFWSYGVANALMATFTHGAALVLQTDYTPQAAVDLIERERCTAAYLLPAFLRDLGALPDDQKSRLSSLETGLTIGRPDEIDVALALGIDGICNIYGATETYGNCCVTPREMPIELRKSCQGPPLPGVEVRFSDPDTGELVPEGPAMIEVRGYTTRGYLGEPELNAKTFTADGWYRTGDLGRLLADGSLQFVARATDMIKTSGINVSPAEVEAFISTIDGVAQCVVVGAPDLRRDEIVVAFVQPLPGRAIDPDDLIGHCKRNIAAFKVPSRVHVLESMPLTDTGKIARLELRRIAADNSPAAGG